MTHSQQLFDQAQLCIPGGVNSPVRAFKSVGRNPLFIKNGKGAYLTDVDGNQYIDYVGSWGPLIVGHAHPFVMKKVAEALESGVSFGAPTPVEVALAQKVCELMPSIEMVRFVSSGTEAAMTSIRLARGYTHRNKIIKFIGCYHGHADSLLVAAGSGALTFGIPSSAGVPDDVAAHTLLANFNQLDQVAALFEKYGSDIAAVIVEPVAGNMNLVLPVSGFLTGLRELCDQYGALLIFDEVITGFRVGLHGAQHHYGVRPDLTVLGKIIGGGFPAAALGGRLDVMQSLAPLGPVYQAGTLSGNPIAMTAGLATLDLITEKEFYSKLIQQTERLVNGIHERAKGYHIPLQTRMIGGMFGLFFTNSNQIETEEDVKRCNIELFKQFFHAMLQERIYLAPSAFEIGFVSSLHQDKEIDMSLSAVEKVFARMEQTWRAHGTD